MSADQNTTEASDQPSPVGDEYVAKYMEGGAALALSKKRMPWWWFALLAFPGLAMMGGLVGAAPSVVGALVGAVLGLGSFALLSLLFSHLRLVVTERVVHVQLGLWGPKIPVERITLVRAKHYDWKQYGGWGIRYGRDGAWAYSVPGGTGDCVEIQWTNDKQKTVTHVISSDDAAGVAAAIERARAAATAVARAGEGTGVRVTDTGATSATSAELEASREQSPEASKGLSERR